MYSYNIPLSSMHSHLIDPRIGSMDMALGPNPYSF